jgi:tRNA 2-selenouridine synthase SelU
MSDIEVLDKRKELKVRRLSNNYKTVKLSWDNTMIYINERDYLEYQSLILDEDQQKRAEFINYGSCSGVLQ